MTAETPPTPAEPERNYRARLRPGHEPEQIPLDELHRMLDEFTLTEARHALAWFAGYQPDAFRRVVDERDRDREQL